MHTYLTKVNDNILFPHKSKGTHLIIKLLFEFQCKIQAHAVYLTTAPECEFNFKTA